MLVTSSHQLLEVQKKQYTEILVLTDIVPANTIKLAKRSITNTGPFLLKSLTGKFQTTNGGECHLLGQMSDSTGNKTLFSDFCPFDLFLSPGTEGNRYLNPLEFEYAFSANSDILFEVKNTSEVDLKYTIAFKGIRFLGK